MIKLRDSDSFKQEFSQILEKLEDLRIEFNFALHEYHKLAENTASKDPLKPMKMERLKQIMYICYEKLDAIANILGIEINEQFEHLEQERILDDY